MGKIEKIEHYSMTGKPSIYDEEALTALELAARAAGKANEVAESQNELVETNEEWREKHDTEIPKQIAEDVEKHITDGEFDKQIDRYAGGLEKRLDNLLGSVPPASTTMDAEIIDARLGAGGKQHPNLGTAMRELEGYADGRVAVYWKNANVIFMPDYKSVEVNAPDLSTDLIICSDNCYFYYKSDGSAGVLGNLTLSWDETLNGVNALVLNAYEPSLRWVRLYNADFNPPTFKPGDIVLCIVWFADGDIRRWVYRPDEVKIYGEEETPSTGGGSASIENGKLASAIGHFSTLTNVPERIEIDTETHTITHASGCLVFDDAAIYYKPSDAVKTVSIDGFAAGTYLVVYDKDNNLKIVTAKTWATGDKVIFTAWLDGNGGIKYPLHKSLNGHPSVLSSIWVDGEPYMPAYSHGTYQSIESIFHGMAKAPGDGEPFKIVIGGDSNTHGNGASGYAQTGDVIIIDGNNTWCRAPEANSWANLFAVYFGMQFNANVINNGCTGTQSTFWENHFNELVPSDTDLLILMIGTNDRAGKSTKTVLDNYRNNLRKIVNKAFSQGTKILLMTPPASMADLSPATDTNNYPANNIQISAVMKDVCAEFNIPCFNTINEMLNDVRHEGGTLSDTLTDDGLHLNDAGHFLLMMALLKWAGFPSIM